MRSTFKRPDGGAITVQPGPAGRSVWITDIAPDGSRTIIRLPLHLCGVIPQAIECAGIAVERTQAVTP